MTMSTSLVATTVKPRKKKVTAAEVAAMQARIAEQERTIADQNKLIAQLVKDTQRDAALIDEMAVQIREDQLGFTPLPHHVDFDWLTQSKADKKSANDELSRKWAEGWRIFHIENSMLARDVTLWRPTASVTPAPAMKVPVQAPAGSPRSVIPVMVSTIEDDPEDFDDATFIKNSDFRMAQSALSAFHHFECSPFFRPAGLRAVRVIQP